VPLPADTDLSQAASSLENAVLENSMPAIGGLVADLSEAGGRQCGVTPGRQIDGEI
jgi:hypothetical protein